MDRQPNCNRTTRGSLPTVLLLVLLLSGLAGKDAYAWDARLWAGADGVSASSGDPVRNSRPGLVRGSEAADLSLTALASSRGSETGETSTLSPLAAGALSALIPGAGQLAQGSQRGWVYLGVEVASLFSVWALRAAGDRAERDSEIFAGNPGDAASRWAWDRYDNVSDCGEGLGPTGNVEQEREDLQNLYQFSRGDYFDEIGDRDIYACGWVSQADRAEFQSLRDSSNDLFRSARAMVTVVFLNHIVSAVDAAKSASNRRHAREQALDVDVDAALNGTMAVHVTMNRRF